MCFRFLPVCWFLNKSVPSVHLSQSCINTPHVHEITCENVVRELSSRALGHSLVDAALEKSLKCGENAKGCCF